MTKMTKKNTEKTKMKEKIGWKEWVALPELDIGEIKAKVDTGACTSALHAEIISTLFDQGEQFIRFKVYHDQSDIKSPKICQARLVANRLVMSSSGHREKRYVIRTPIIIGNLSFVTEITLTDRSPLRFRMLLGRLSLKKHFLIDPAKTHLLGRPNLNLTV